MIIIVTITILIIISACVLIIIMTMICRHDNPDKQEWQPAPQDGVLSRL